MYFLYHSSIFKFIITLYSHPKEKELNIILYYIILYLNPEISIENAKEKSFQMLSRPDIFSLSNLQKWNNWNH